MRKYVPKRQKSSASMFLTTTFFSMILILSVFVYSDFSIPLASAQSLQPVLPAPTTPSGITTSPDFDGSNTITDSDGNILQQQGQSSPFYPTSDGLVTQYPYSPIYPYQDPYEVQSADPLSPTQTLPGEKFFLQENSIVDVTPPETNIVSVIDGNNTSLQEGGMTTSGIAVLEIQGTDDIAVTALQCSLDNVQQDPLVCGTNPVVVENLQPGTHFFQTSSVDSAGNMDASPAVFSWNVVPGDLVLGDQQTQQQFQLQLPQQPFQLPIPEQQYLQPSPLAITPEQQQQQQQQPSSIPVIDPFQNQSSVLSPYYQQFLQQQEQLQPQITPQSSPLFPFNSYNNRSFSSNLSTSTPSPFPSALPSPTPSVQPLQLEQPVLLLSNNTSNFQNQSKIDSGVEQPLPISNSTNTSQNQSIIDSSVQPDNQTATAVAEGELQPLSATERMSLLSSLEAGDEIPNHYIVVLKDTQLGASANISIQTPSQAAADAKSKGAEVRHVYENALKGFAIRVPNDQVPSEPFVVTPM